MTDPISDFLTRLRNASKAKLDDCVIPHAKLKEMTDACRDPDVAAAAEGPGREEFFIEHHHVFSPASLVLMAEKAGLSLTRLERLREPSSKFTLAMFAGKAR